MHYIVIGHRHALLLLILFSLTLSPAWAEETLYVSDLLVINIKSSLEKPYTITGLVRSDDPLVVLEEKDDYRLVRTRDGKEGWIAAKYLVREIPKSMRIEKLEAELAQAREAQLQRSVEPAAYYDKGEIVASLEEKLQSAENQIQLLEKQLRETAVSSASAMQTPVDEQLLVENQQLTEKANILEKKYTLLVDEYENRGKEIADLQSVIAKHDDTTRFIWFAVGAAVFFAGMLAGKSGSRKKGKLLY